MVVKLYLKDKKILSELDIDSRQSFTKIANKVGLSKEVVNYRIKRLINEGTIKGFYPIIDVSRFGYSSYRIFLRFQNLTTEKEKKIINYLQNQNSVGWIVFIRGNWDINFVTWNSTNNNFQTFWKINTQKWINDLRTHVWPEAEFVLEGM